MDVYILGEKRVVGKLEQGEKSRNVSRSNWIFKLKDKWERLRKFQGDSLIQYAWQKKVKYLDGG